MLNNKPVHYAGFPVRLVAYFVDLIIIFIILAFIRLPMFFASLSAPEFILFRPILFKFSAWNIIIYLLSALYFSLSQYYLKASFGKKLFNLKVIADSNEDKELSFFSLFYRETIGRYLAGLFYIGYIFIPFNKKKKGLHDMLVDSAVVYDFKFEPAFNRPFPGGRRPIPGGPNLSGPNLGGPNPGGPNPGSPNPGGPNPGGPNPGAPNPGGPNPGGPNPGAPNPGGPNPGGPNPGA